MLKEFKLNEKVTLRNRVVVAPMTTWSSNENLTVSDEEAKFLGARSKGAGMVVTGCTFYSEEGQGFENEFYAGSDEFIPSLKKLADAIKTGGAKAVLQIFHAGRMGMPTKELVSASAIKPTHSHFGPIEEAPTPRELTNEEVWGLIDGFYHTTRRAIEAGFDGVEIHGANTFLIQQFFSPHSNRRDDEFGGSLEKRMRFPLELVKAANRAKNEFANEEFIIGYRFSPEEMENPGITLEDTLALVDKLSEEDITYLHASLGHYKATSMRDKEDKRLIGKLVSDKIGGRKPFIGVGSIYTKEEAEEAISEIGYDLIAIGHAIVTDKDWVEKIEKGITPNRKIRINHLEEQVIPKKLGNAINAFTGWFEIDNQ